jgi:hypothetical protein
MDGKSMRYNHESYLPIGAFQPILGRMTLHGGGGGFISDIVESVSDFIAPVTDAINDAIIQPASDVLAGADDLVFQPVTAPISQVTSALDDAVIQPITEPISDVGVAIDDSVNEVIPGGWGTLAQFAAAATGNPAIIGATSAGVNFARNKDLKSAIEAGIISGGTAGITQGFGEAFQLGDLAKAGVSAGVGGAADYAKTGDINSALRAGATSGAMSYGGSQLAPYTGEFGKFLEEQGVKLSNYANPSGTSDLISAYPGTAGEGLVPTDLVSPATTELISAPAGASGEGLKSLSSNLIKEPTTSFFDSPTDYITEKGIDVKDYLANKTTGAVDYLKDTPLSEMPGDLYDAAKDYYNNASKTDLALLAAGAYGLSNLVGGGGDEQQPQTQAEADAAAKKAYTYGTAGPMSPNYLLKNRVNAGNVYSNATGYKPLTRYADGGEVEHFRRGGLKGLEDFATRVTQPFEKAILRPIGEAAPFLKDMAPYAGIAAGAMVGNPAIAAGIGGLASGFGKPGGFDMKRALMGGIAAYGMSNLGAGIEAAGQTPLTDSAALPFESYPDPQNQVGGFYGPSGQTNQLPAANPTFRNPDVMKQGISNLLENSNTPAYKNAMSGLTSKAGVYSAGLPLIMGTTGMMGVDESNALKQEYDKSMATSQAEADKFNARVAAGKKRAQQAVSENPYMFAMGGSIDDEYGGDDMNTVNGNMQNGFMGYADGGPVTNAEDLDYMVQIENNRNEVDPMSDERYAGLLKQNQDYLSNIYGNIYNKPASEQPDIETVRANAQKALDMNKEVMSNITDATTAVNTAQDLIGTPTTPPPVVTTPDPVAPTPPPINYPIDTDVVLKPTVNPVITEPIATTPSPRATEPTAANPKGQYLVSNPTSSSPLSSSNIYEYQKKRRGRGFAEGGVPRFLSGGGDGMSDSIKAKIEGTQEARLADGEFVIPADVVSHLGNGSSKAGAKQLYDMMDRVRKARTGNPKQGREIKPTKLMPV